MQCSSQIFFVHDAYWLPDLILELDVGLLVVLLDDLPEGGVVQYRVLLQTRVVGRIGEGVLRLGWWGGLGTVYGD